MRETRQAWFRGPAPWQSLLLVFVIAVVLIFSRRPDALLNPQFYAEDGAVWYAQAYNLGGWHALLLPDGGYLNTLPRLAAAVALPVPLQFAPLLLNLMGIALQALPAVILLSSRCGNWGSLRARLVMAAMYVALPNSQEINVVITNAQWHLALAVAMLCFSTPARTLAWKLTDGIALVVSGLTGPFSLVLLPLTLLFYWKRRAGWSLVQACILAICAGVQILELHESGDAQRGGLPPLGATFPLLVRLVGGQVVIGAWFGANIRDAFWPLGILAVAAVFGLGIMMYGLLRAPLELKLFTAFCLALFAGALRSPLITGFHPRWQLLEYVAGGRYWFFPMLAMVWTLAWGIFHERKRLLRAVAGLVVAAMLVGVVRDWRYPAFKDRQFSKFTRLFDNAPAGALVVIPIDPDNTMELRKRAQTR